MSEPIVSAYEMGKQLLDALGLADLRCVTKLHITVESGSIPKLSIERAITKKEAGALCVLLRSWKCEIRPGIVTERPLTEPVSAPAEQVPVHPENAALAERITELKRVSLLPADAAAAVEEIFGKLDPERPTPFEPTP